MTICIAAICEVNNDPKIVLCSDWKLSSALGSAETGFKQRAIGKLWISLFSGDVSAARALIILFKKHLQPTNKLDETSVVQFVRAALNERKSDLANELSQGRFALSYDNLLKFDKEQLPSDKYNAAIADIAAIKLGAEFIIAGYAGSLPILVETDEYCRAAIKEHFAAVGEGRYLAHSVLLHRSHEEISRLGRALYCVYEAKRFAERIPSVGPATSIIVLHVDKTSQIIMPVGMDFLKERSERRSIQS